MGRYDYLRGTHDLPTLSDWGPFARDVYGLSHIADVARGLRFDFFIVPGIFRRQFYWPDPLRENGCSPAEASPDLRHFSFRQRLEDGGRFCCETSYTQLEEDLWLGRCLFVNRGRERQSASMLFYTRVSPTLAVQPVLPAGCSFTDGLEYSALRFASVRYDHHLTSSGGRRGEQPYPGTVGGTCLGLPHYDGELKCFAEEAGDSVTYPFRLVHRGEGRLLLRALAGKGTTFELKVHVGGAECTRAFVGSGGFELLEIHCGVLPEAGEVTLVSGGVPGGLRVDGLVAAPGEVMPEAIGFLPAGREVVPECVSAPAERYDTFSGKGLRKGYAVWWSCQEAARREYWLRDLAHLVSYSNNLRHPFYYTFPDSEAGNVYCRDIYTLPIEIPAGGEALFHVLYCAGANAGAAKRRLQSLDRSEAHLEARFREQSCVLRPQCTASGRRYRQGRDMLAAAVLTNVNFPIRAEGKNIRHHVPDKHFNSLYSWDSGFIGLGMLELDETRAVENLNAYLTEPENEVNAFLFHGTPLPVQAYLFRELFNRTQDRELLAFLYPKLKHFYDFLSGHIPTSVFRTAKSDLLRPWRYTYNAGGWDDYPPQWRILLEKHFSVAPVANTAHQIRFAKILRFAAELLGRPSDCGLYEADVAAFARGLQRYSYDESEEVFSMVEHDAAGRPCGFYLDPASGRNYNLGMDGVSPLVAGICTARQRDAMFARLADPARMWTPIGISTVDRQAPYFRTDGYWNGAVWMPHQWFFWKAALDDGRAAFARRIALTALGLWEAEVRRTGYCFEHFCLSSGHGAGCCHFGGLSSPVLNWFASYCVKGTFTCGFDTWVLEERRRTGCFAARLRIEGEAGDFTTVLYTNGARRCKAVFNGVPAGCESGVGGCWEVRLPKASEGWLEVRW